MKYPESDDGGSRVAEPRAIYVPIFDSFFESSIMQEALAVRFVMLALIRLAWRPRSNGIVDVDLRLFAASINVPVADVESAIRRLMEPDEHSGSKLEEGRRILPLDPERPMRGWRVVNWLQYKKLLTKANDKVRKANERAGHFGQNGHVTHDTIRYETKLDEKNTKRERERFAPPTLAEAKSFFESEHLTGNAEAFFYHFEANGWVSGRTKLRSWKAAAHKWSSRESDYAAPQEPRMKREPRTMPSGDVRLPTGGYAAADGSWFDYRGERYFRSGDTYRTTEGYAPDGTHKQNTAYTESAREIANHVLGPVLK
jgi:hypothetical protein